RPRRGAALFILPAVVIALERRFAMRIVPVAVLMVHPRLAAAAVARVGQADTGGNAVGAGVRPEVGIEGSVLLRNDDDMADLVNARFGDLMARSRGRVDGHDADGDGHRSPRHPERSHHALRTRWPSRVL